MTSVRSYRTINKMNTISVNQFRDNLRHYADLATQNHEPVTVTRRNGEDFVVISREDWLSLEETLYVMQNKSLMEQIEASIKTHQNNTGRIMSQQEIDEINNI